MGKQIIDGFYFEDAKTAAVAEKEAETVRYIRARTDMSRIDAVYGIYKKLMENNVLSTMVGYSFLSELYRLLQDSGMYPDDELPKIYIREEERIAEAVRNRTKTLNDTSKTQVRNIREMYRDKLKTYKMVIAVLSLCIIGMLALVYFSDASPLRDAEKQVLDKYAAWQETLQEKEVFLQTWEKELEERENRLSGQ